MHKIFLAAMSFCMGSTAFAGDVGWRYGLPSHHGTDHYSIWAGTLPPGIVPIRLCLAREKLIDGEVMSARWRRCPTVARRARH